MGDSGLLLQSIIANIMVKCLELNPGLLHGLRFRYSGCLVVKYKLKEQIDIDELHRLEYFEFYRPY